MTNIDLSLLPDYLIEASEHLEEMESLLLNLVDEPESTELMNEIFRPIHSIKGAAQFIGLERSSRLAHRLEDLLDLLRKGEHPSSAEVVELLISARDLIVSLAEELESTQAEVSSVDDMVNRITAEIENGTGQEETAVSGDASAASEESVAEEATVSAYEEENDQELFGIFLENMREKIDLVRTQSAELESSTDKVALLERCAENVQALQSAANYMGYDELTTIYGNWQEDITAVQDAIGSNEDVPYDFMDGYLTEILSIFPQLNQQSSAASENVVDEIKEQVFVEENRIESNKFESNSDVDLSLLPDYLIEASEHLEEMESLLLNLVDEPESTELMNEIFRPIHSIKGAAQFIGLERSSRLAHRLEDLLDLLRKGEHPSSAEVVELLISARDLIVSLAEELESTQAEVSSVDDMVNRITAEIENGTGQEETAVSGDASAASEESVAEEATVSAYEEENDQELFGIFLENMREKIDLVRTQSAELESSTDKVALLERCAENVQALQSAANYMGYDELTTIYGNWQEDITAVQDAIGSNEDVPYDFMDGYLTEILSIFPQLSIKIDPQTQQLDSQQTDEEKLFHKLSNALDTDASRPEEAEYELLHGVFEEMISDREEVSPEKPIPEKQAVEKKAVTTANNKKPAEKSTASVTSTDAAEAKTQASSTEKVVSKKAIKKAGAETTSKASDKALQAETPKQKQQVKAKENQRKTAGNKTGDIALKKNIRVEAEKIDSLINQVGELVVDRAYFFQLFEDMRGLQQHFKDDIGLDQKEMKEVRAFTYRMGEAIASLSRTSNELQEGVMKIRMLPISQLFNRYPRLVHDLTRNNNKKVNLKVEGEDTELDKMVVEKLSDPLIHIIRNAVDHGLEGAKDRVDSGKSETGTLFLRSYHESNQVVVEIMDDGRGIDPELVKRKAIEKGVVSKNEADRMTPQELIRLITAAGFSTADTITDTSGRGVGMDVVRKNIEKLNGTLEIDSRLGQGTSIRLKIPLTLAIIPAHLVRVSGNMYTIPLANIEETLRISKGETTVIEGTEVVYLREKTLPIIHLSKLFNTQNVDEDDENFFVVVVNTGTQKIGLVVDELLGQEEVVIKPLEDYLRDQSGFSGATIIGDGSISLILDIYEIANMMANEQIRRQQERTMQRKSVGSAS